MPCLPWDFTCMAGEFLAPIISTIWIFIQVMAFVFGFAIVFMLTRKIYKGRYFEANALIGLWAGYFAYKMAAYLAIFGAVASVIVVLLAIFTPVGGIIVTWLLTKVGAQPKRRFI